jgi:hypothetical protein
MTDWVEQFDGAVGGDLKDKQSNGPPCRLQTLKVFVHTESCFSSGTGKPPALQGPLVVRKFDLSECFKDGKWTLDSFYTKLRDSVLVTLRQMRKQSNYSKSTDTAIDPILYYRDEIVVNGVTTTEIVQIGSADELALVLSRCQKGTAKIFACDYWI